MFRFWQPELINKRHYLCAGRGCGEQLRKLISDRVQASRIFNNPIKILRDKHVQSVMNIPRSFESHV